MKGRGQSAPLRSSLPHGEMAEWLKAHAWKACIRETVSRVRIPVSPPFFQCIIKGRPICGGEGCLCRRCHCIWLQSNRKTECCECVVGRECWARPGDGGFVREEAGTFH